MGENRIWYCREYECLFDGWVIGKKEKVQAKDKLFSKYAETNGYRLYMKWSNDALEEDYPTCGCDLQEETNQHAYHKTTGWYARRVAKDGRDDWVKQYPYAGKLKIDVIQILSTIKSVIVDCLVCFFRSKNHTVIFCVSTIFTYRRLKCQAEIECYSKTLVSKFLCL